MGLVHFIVSSVYTLAGLSAFIVFMLMQYYTAAVFGFITAVISAVTAHINWLHKNRRLTLWYEQTELSQLYWLGFSTFTIGFSCFVYCLVYYLLLQQYSTRIDLAVACIWSFISVKSALILMYYSHKYVQESQAPCLITNQAS